MGNNNDVIKKRIEYPLQGYEKLFDNDKLYCSNVKTQNHSDIDIEYNKKNNFPSIYRCPICLNIPYFYYDNLLIIYTCNCGTHKCNIDYFFKNFQSYPIKKISFKEKIKKGVEIKFCSTCSKFIYDLHSHRKIYYGHIIRSTADIFLNSKNNCFQFWKNFDFPFNGNNLSLRKVSPFDKGNTIKYSLFIKKHLNFEIKEINLKYEEFINNLKSVCHDYDKKDYEDKIKFNQKLLLLVKYLYFVFIQNYSEKKLIFQILINLFYAKIQIFGELPDDAGNNTFFFKKLKDIMEYNQKYLELDNNIIYYSRFKSEQFTPIFTHIFYDIYSERFVHFNKDYNFFCFSQKNNISNIYLIASDAINAKIIFFKKLNKNIVVFQRKFYYPNNLYVLFSDIEKGEILSKIMISYKFFSSRPHIEDGKYVKFLDLISDQYWVMNIHGYFFIYSCIQSNGKLSFNYIKDIDAQVEQIFYAQKLFMFLRKYTSYILFTFFDENKIEFKKAFQLNGFKNTEIANIIDIKNNRILIGLNNNKLIIYNVKNRQIETKIIFNFKHHLIIFERYMIIFRSKEFMVYSIPTMKIISKKENIVDETNIKGIYKREDGVYYLIYNKDLYEITNKELIFKEKLSFYDYDFSSYFLYSFELIEYN